MTADALAADPELGSYPLRCDQCGRTIECTADDLRVFATDGPPPCCGQPMASPTIPAAPALTARPGRRRPARPGVMIQLRRRAAGSIPDLFGALADVSANGLGVRLESPADEGDRIEATMRAPSAARPVVVTGEVRWCRPVAGHRYLAGIYLDRPLTAAELDGLGR
jgi:hypothetical protein